MNNNDYVDAFYSRKSGGGSAYNYELTPLITNFTFYDFVVEVEKSKKEQLEHGGFLVITNNQYIIGYNAGFGVGTHMSSFARTMADINYGSNSKIASQQEALKLDIRCSKQYITARIIYEYYGHDENGIPQYSGYINFALPDIGGKITPQQFETFKEFYKDYNEDIKWITRKYNFYVRFCYRDETGKMQAVKTNDLDELYNYLEKNIDFNKVIEEEKIIIGKERKNRKKDT